MAMSGSSPFGGHVGTQSSGGNVSHQPGGYVFVNSWWVDFVCPFGLDCLLSTSFATDPMEVGVWKTLRDLQDPELLVSCLPDTVLHRWTNSTVSKYLGAFHRWKDWVEQKVVVYPVQEVHFAPGVLFVMKTLEDE